MPISQRNEHPDVSSDTNRLSSNVFWNEKLHRWDTIDKNKDSFVIDIVNDLDEAGYMSIKRAPATTGEPSFTALFHIDKDGNQYMGDPDTNGTVRLTNDSGVFKVYVREAGTYNLKGGFG